MKISKIIISNVLINQISPLDFQKVIRCNKFFNKQISLAIKTKLNSFRSLNPWLNDQEDIESQKLLIFNAHMIHQLFSTLRINDLTQFNEFVFNSQDSKLKNVTDTNQFIDDNQYDDFNDKINQYKMIRQNNIRLHEEYHKPDFSNGIYIGYQYQTEQDEQETSEDKLIAFELFLKQFCNLKIVESQVRNYVFLLLKNFDAEYEKSLNIVSITYKCLIKSNTAKNIILAREISMYQSQYDILTLNEYSDIYQQLLDNQRLPLINYLEQFDFKYKSNIQQIFIIQDDYRNEANLDYYSNALRYQYHNEIIGLNISSSISYNMDILFNNIKEKLIQKFVEIVQENKTFKGFYIVQEYIKILDKYDHLNEDYQEFLNNRNSIPKKKNSNEMKEINKFFFKQLIEIEIDLFKGNQQILNSFCESYNQYVINHDLQEMQGLFGYKNLRTQSKFCCDLSKNNNNFIANPSGPQTQPYQILQCVIEQLNIQAILLIDQDAKFYQLQDLLLDLIFKNEYTSKNLIQSEYNNNQNKYISKEQLAINFVFSVSTNDDKQNSRFNTHNFQNKNFIYGNHLHQVLLDDDQFDLNKSSIKQNVTVLRVDEDKWIDELLIDDIKQKKWLNDNQIYKKSKIIYYYFENEPKTYENQMRINQNNQSKQKFDDFAKYINKNEVKQIN